MMLFWLGLAVGLAAGSLGAWMLAGIFTVRLIRSIRALPERLALPPPKGRHFGPIRSDLNRR